MNALLIALLSINLSGTWQFSIDRSAEGVRPLHYDQTIELPGSMLTNGLGDDVTVDTRWVGSLYDSSYFFNPKMKPYREPGRMKFPFFLTPEKHYVGNAWYSRTVRVPKNWKGQRVTLYLERPHIETTLYVNGDSIGHQMSLSVPHQYDITDHVKFGKENTIELKIYNGIENVCVGQDSHSVTDQTQGDWNGIVGQIELRNEPVIWRKRVEPDVDNASAKIFLNDTVVEVKLEQPMRLWDEFHPELYTVTVDYRGQQVPVTFGMRKVGVRGRDIMLNDKVLKVRGTVGNCCFPETGYAPTDVASWKAVFAKCKEYGLNTMRFHSYCPPEAAFIAADSLGFYLQPEGPSWPNHGVRLGQGQAIDTYLMEECKAIIDQYGSHPSFVMLAAGNEPAGRWVAWCNKFVPEMHRYDPTRIYADASVGGGWAWADSAEFHVKGGARGLDPWDKALPQSMDDFADGMALPRNFKPTAAKPVNTAPIVSHETGQWCAFPDLTEIDQYTGAYKARNFEIFSDLLADAGMSAMSRKFLMASGKLQTLAYKYDIERNLRTPDYAGFLLLGLNDYSGQGTALVGPLNVHWREKGYCTADDWTEFCSDVVPLARFPKFVFSADDTIRIGTMLYNAADRPETVGDELMYSFMADGLEFKNGMVRVGDDVVFVPRDKDKAQKITFMLRSGTHSNHWDFWVYPARVEMPSANDIYVCDSLDEKALATLQSGGKVLLTAGGKIRYGNDVKHHYLPVFWNTSWFKMRPPHTTGSYIESGHPIFRNFPTDDWQNLNWWELVNRTQVMNLAHFPAELQPIVQPIDTWHISRRLGMLFEANVAGGRLVMTTMDLANDLDSRIVARQLRRSILDYMESDSFRPSATIDPAVITELFTTEAPAVNMFTRDTPDELKPRLGAATVYELTLPAAPSADTTTFHFGTCTSPDGHRWQVDSRGFLADGKPVVPVMGEIHYARVPRSEWKRELQKMRDGGVTIVSTYVFWLHHEPVEGQWRWDDNRDLRAFVETCREVGLPVVLRVGPFCHGEALQGGFPTWLVEKALADSKQYKLRSLAPGFMEATGKLYAEIFRQVDGLLFKQGGPIVGMQIENECRGPWPYYAALKKLAVEAGFDLPFYTRTGWPKLNGREEFGQLLPLYGDYADGFWDRSMEDMPGGYPNAFVFKPGRISENIATETFKRSELQESGSLANAPSYPYLTCELGGGMMTAYHRRVRIFPKDALALAICKVGSGSNLPGYYMYHGGTNPGLNLAEKQASAVTNHNDLPQLSYDFQSPVGEVGQINESYHWTRRFHLFLHDFGPMLRDMPAVFPATNDENGRRDSTLRFAVRTDGRSGFIFVNNYRRMHPLSAKEGVQFRFALADSTQLTLPAIDIAADACFVLPFGLKLANATLDWATAQPVCWSAATKTLTLAELPGMEAAVSVGGITKLLSVDKPLAIGGINIRLLNEAQSLAAYLDNGQCTIDPDRYALAETGKTIGIKQVRSANGLREVKKGSQKVAEQPSDDDYAQAAVWQFSKLKALADNDIVQINYAGDVARLYVDGRLVQDNQWNGNPMLVRASQLRGKKVLLKVLPLGKDYPIYLQPEQRETLANAPATGLCELQGVTVLSGK